MKRDPKRSLNPKAASAAKAMFAAGATIRRVRDRLRAEFDLDVSRAALSNVRRGVTWKSL